MIRTYLLKVMRATSVLAVIITHAQHHSAAHCHHTARQGWQGHEDSHYLLPPDMMHAGTSAPRRSHCSCAAWVCSLASRWPV
jgi:hypothetical protein